MNCFAAAVKRSFITGCKARRSRDSTLARNSSRFMLLHSSSESPVMFLKGGFTYINRFFRKSKTLMGQLIYSSRQLKEACPLPTIFLIILFVDVFLTLARK